ncbi:hypothetical protein SAMN05660464_4469 [Geodermatophilus dictyosporus]|uniref:Effector-associated domain-containing protein n=1 Tax=Geodermatophilus dictyosporus TaxID=1523247 RepID=A0A1I5TR51_9ACTN|nr:effector-associated domain EAD1-containing protein [Geodermatophilus dictyosporus]SFP85552.1 hypothetical protein SAMN05660464_4469 [Geodermatophilus dictyosporus]
MTTAATLDSILRERYPTRRQLREFVRRRLGENLDDYVGTGGLRDVAFQLVEAADSNGWDLASALERDRILSLATPVNFNLLDLATFDLQSLVDGFYAEQLRAGTRRVLGIAVAWPDTKFVRYFCDRLQRALGGTWVQVDPDGTTLNPEMWSTDVAVRRIASQSRNLQVRHIVFPVWCDRADGQAIKRFWQGVRGELTSPLRYLVLVLLTAPDTDLPVDVAALPVPSVNEEDIHRWTVEVVNALGWPVELAVPWKRRLLSGAELDGELNLAMLYTILDDDVQRVRDAGAREEFYDELRRSLQEARS